MNITFVNPPTNDIGTSVKYPNLGLLYLAAVAADAGHNVKMIDAYVERLGAGEIIRRVKEYRTDLLAAYTSIVSIDHVTELARRLRKSDGKIAIAIGGPHVSAIHKTYFEEHKDNIDFIVRGEGELTFKELLDNFGGDYSTIPGLSYKKDAEILVNPPRPHIADLDVIPYPRWEVLPALSYYRKTRAKALPFMPIIMTRGCDQKCSYCSKHVFGPNIKFRSVENVEGEVRRLVNEFGVRELQVNDDNFIADREFTESLASMFSSKFKILIRLCNGVRPDLLDEDLILRLKSAGVYYIGVAIDSAEEKILEKCRRNVDLKHAEEVIKLLKKHEIISNAYFVLGLPGETRESIVKTMKYIKRANPDMVTYTMFAHLPGTPAYKQVHKEGRLTDYYKGHVNYFGRVNWVPPGLTEEYLKNINKRAYADFFFPFKWMQSLYTVLRHSSFQEFRSWIRDGVYLFLRGNR